MSAAGGLVGAVLHTLFEGPLLTAVLGCLLVFAGLTGLTGLAERLRLEGWKAWLAGGISGFLGGLVGNQGGIRSAAMLGFDVRKDAFVATATAVGLMVDGARIPVYLVTHWMKIVDGWPFLIAATLGVVMGTIIGQRVLRRIPELAFRRLVSAVILVLGAALLAGAVRTVLN